MTPEPAASRIERAGYALLAAALVYLGAVFVEPIRRFDDATKYFQHIHRANDRLHAHGVPALTSWATALVLLCVVGLAVTLALSRHAPVLVRVRAAAVPAVSLGLAELGKWLLPRPVRGWEPSYLTTTSYPSGHVALAGGCILAALLVLPPRRGLLPLAAFALTVVIATVVAAAQHRLFDAVGGALAALTAAALVGPVAPAAPGARFLRRIAAAVAGGAAVTMVAVAVAPHSLADPSRPSVNVAYAFAVVIGAVTASVVVAVSAESASSRTDASAAASAPSPRSAVHG